MWRSLTYKDEVCCSLKPFQHVIDVLDFGRLIFAGTTSQTLESEVVRRAYLGTERVGEPREAQGVD